MEKLSKDEPLAVAKLTALDEVLRSAAGLWVEATAAEPYVTPGGEVKVTTTLVNRSGFPVKWERLGVSSAGADLLREELKTNQPVSRERGESIPAGGYYP